MTESLSVATDVEKLVHKGELVPLLIAVAMATGRTDLMSSKYQPRLLADTTGTAPHGGMDPSVVSEAQRLVAQVIEDTPTEVLKKMEPSDNFIAKALEFMTGQTNERYIPILKRELGMFGDIEAPLPMPAAEGEQQSRVAVIGAGLSGLLATYRLLQAGYDVVTFEKNSELGGTWYENKYPGCRLDTSNFGYSYSFHQQNWNHYFSTRDEIQSYLSNFALEKGITECINYSTVVRKLHHNGRQWEVSYTEGTEQLITETFDFVVTALGQLNKPKIPNLEGLNEFEGQYWHSATWPKDIDLTGKKIIVVGAGASAFQIVPNTVDKVQELTLLFRTPPWVLPTPGYNSPLPKEFKELLERIPSYGRWLRFYQFWLGLEGRRRFVVVDSEWEEEGSVSSINKQFRNDLEAVIQAQFSERPDLQQMLTPSYAPGSKRILRDDGAWAEALQRPNCNVYDTAIKKVSSQGITLSDGTEVDADYIIFATGFETDSFFNPIEVTVSNDPDIGRSWDSDPVSLYGIHPPDLPNLFMLYGPNTNLVVNGSVVFMTECAVHRITRILSYMKRHRYTSTWAPAQAVRQFTKELDSESELMAWGHKKVDTWYKGKTGRVISVWPFSMLDFWQKTHDIDYQELCFT